MPSRKQRRRREKLKRHEWELVSYDEEGNEVAVEPARLRNADEQAKRKPDANGKPQRKGAPAKGGRRPMREVKPPSWNRAIKRALIFVPVLFLFLSYGKNAPALQTRVALSVLYAVVFIPMFFFVDRLTYRAYQRRAGDSS